MSAKRKHSACTFPDGSPPASLDPPVSTAVTRTSAQNYPRKRVSIACEVCRHRKTRCDARKPACSLCLELGIECVYRRPGLWDREAAKETPEPITIAVEERLGRIEHALNNLIEHLNSNVRNDALSNDISSQRGSTTQEYASPTSFSRLRLHYRPQFYDGAERIKSRSYGYKMPTLLSFHASRPFNCQAYNLTDFFFCVELKSGESFFTAIETTSGLDPAIDLSTRTCWTLQQAFAENFLRWIPLFPNEVMLKHLNIASKDGCTGNGASTCLVMFIHAIGALSEDRSLYKNAHELAGFGYLVRAYKLLVTLPPSSPDITVVQCRILFAIYLLFAMRPLQAWTVISQASKECMLLANTDRKLKGEEFIDLLERAYWTSYVIENELEVCLELPASQIRSFEGGISLPTSRYEEDGLYYFLALASHRKLLMDIVDSSGFEPGIMFHAPLVTLELRSQLQDWYNHLPAILRFPLDSSPIFDPRKANLRSQFYASMAVISWPFILEMVDVSQDLATETSSKQDQTSAQEERAAEYLENCCVYIQVSEGTLTRKCLVSHITLRSFFALNMVLLICYKHPCLERSQPSNMKEIIIQATSSLIMWHEVPFMKEPLRQMQKVAESKGLWTDVQENCSRTINKASPILDFISMENRV